MKDLKYLSGYLIPLCAVVAIIHPAQLAFLPLAFAFGLIPFFELLLPKNKKNITENEEIELLKENKFDYMLWLSFPVQWGLLIFFIYSVSTNEYTALQLTGMTLGVGICSGVLGINAAHELGHRLSKFEQFLAQGLLLSSLYTHFFVEHNRGHHKYVATPHDPASARLNESMYLFVPRSVVGSYISAWKIQMDLLKKQGLGFFHYQNNMLIYLFLQLALCLVIFSYGGSIALLLFLATAAIGITLLEVINYVEHYGMRRKEVTPGKYEKVMPHHSWNANYPIGRIMLFELTRHADHHYKASRKYQILRHWELSPELPAGYPAMMLLSTIPPLWFWVMNPRVKHLEETLSTSVNIA
ncbi:MAG: alkane 1-monooxygenase [Bacteroidia bacterium]